MTNAFDSKVSPAGDCLVWTGAKRNGYGVFHVPGTRNGTVRSHRYAYESAHGPVPAGMVIDHLCGNKACVNVRHLEVVTQKENVQRHFRKTTECKHGHPYNEANTYVSPKGRRSCRACNRERHVSPE